MGTYLESKSFLLVELVKRQNQKRIIFIYFITGDMRSLISLTIALALLYCVAGDDKCPEEKYPKDFDTRNCYKNLGNTWCSDELPLAKSEWGEWICKNCGSCIPRHENNSSKPECSLRKPCSSSETCDNGHCVCMDTSKHACAQAWSPLSAPRLPYDCARSFSKRKTCPKMCGVCGTSYIEKSDRRGCVHAKGGNPLRCYHRGSIYRNTRSCEYACSITANCVGFSQGKFRTSRQYDCNLFVSGGSCPTYYRTVRGKVANSVSDLVGTGPGNFNCKVKKE